MNTSSGKRKATRRTAAKRSRPREKAGSRKPRWVAFAAAITFTLLLCAAVNFRAFSEMTRESRENKTLTNQIEQMRSENLILKEEIKDLKDDPRTIEREARKLGMSRPNEKILVPEN